MSPRGGAPHAAGRSESRPGRGAKASPRVMTRAQNRPYFTSEPVMPEQSPVSTPERPQRAWGGGLRGGWQPGGWRGNGPFVWADEQRGVPPRM